MNSELGRYRPVQPQQSTTDKVLIQGWYLGAERHVELFQLAGGQQLQDSQVQTLVQAMAVYAPPALGQVTLVGTYQTGLEGVINASWQAPGGSVGAL